MPPSLHPLRPVLAAGALVCVLAACAAGPGDTAAPTATQPAAGLSTQATTGSSVDAQPSANPSSSGAPPTSPGTSTTPQPVSFAFAGEVQFPDVMDTEPGAISTGLPLLADQLRADPMHVLDPVTPVLSSADLAMVNLETAITERGEPVPIKNFHFRSPAATFTAVKAGGIDVVNMANNHSLDYGPVAMQDTFDAIAASGFPVVGIGHNATEAYRPYRTVIKGQRIAIFGALDNVEPALIPGWGATDTKPGIALATERARLLDAIRTVRPEVDTLIVFLHWGTEQTICASPAQADLSSALIGAGADIVVGSHAHRVFGAGRVGDAFVAYGLGNFVYWREDDESGRSGVLLVTATGRHVDSYSWVPARIHHGIPIPQTGAAAAADIAEWEHRRTCSGLAP